MKRTQILCDGDHQYQKSGLVIDPAEDACFSVLSSPSEKEVSCRPGIVEQEGWKHFCSRSCASLMLHEDMEIWEREQYAEIEARNVQAAPPAVPVPPDPTDAPF